MGSIRVTYDCVIATVACPRLGSDCILGHVLVLSQSCLVMIHKHGAGGEEHQSMSRGGVFVWDRNRGRKRQRWMKGKGACMGKK